MSREIKFRAWDKKHKRYVKVLKIYFGSNGHILGAQVEDYDTNFAFELQAAQFVLERYTGLKDKNGEKIYEGDIVRINDDYEEYGTNAGGEREIWFRQGGFRYKPEPWSTAYEMGQPGCWLDDGADCEVIGNIHENRELIGGEE